MSMQSNAAPLATQSKRSRLKEIVSRLGRDATPAQIREEAYRTGFGAVNSGMLVSVRNELWPDRLKHAGGYAPMQTRCTQGVRSCPLCASPRTVSHHCHFQKTTGKWQRKRECRACCHVFYTTDEGRFIASVVVTQKKCTYCRQTLPVADFPLVANHAARQRPGCKKCYANQWSNRSQKTTLARYDLPEDWYERTLAEQGGKCAICGTDNPGLNGKRREGGNVASRRFMLDHCHRTGKVRGLLCSKCNLGIGNFNDDVGRLAAAVA
jgi:hypothetical protein